MSEEVSMVPAVVETKPKSLAEVGEQINYIQDFIAKFLKKDTDYGIIPGTKKPTLYKPGAEKLGAAFSLTAEYETVDSQREPFKEWSYTVTRYDKQTGQENTETLQARGYYWYRVHCKLFNRQTGVVWATQDAECDSTERGRETAPSNTILKMAQKRAYVGAMLNATFTSDRFTADLEDYSAGQVSTGQATGGTDGDIPKPGRKMKSKFGSNDSPTKCGICGNYHIVKDDMIYLHPTIKTEKGKPAWGKPECYAASFKNGDKKPPEETPTSTPSTDPVRQDILDSIPGLEVEVMKKDKTFKVPDARKAACGSPVLNDASDDALVAYMGKLQEKLAGAPG